MKIFFISLGIFSTLSALIFFNSIYINATADKLDALATEITEDWNRVSELEDFWDKNMKRVEFSVNHTLVNEIGKRIKNIRHYYNWGQEDELNREIMLLHEELKELKRLDKISVNNIF